MTVADLAAGRAPRAGRLRSSFGRPALVAEGMAAAAWVLVVVHPLAVATGVHQHGGTTPWSWSVGAAAMMLPGALPAARHVGVNSLRRRRHRAVALYVTAYLAVWTAYGAAAVALFAPGPPPLALVLLAAAAWQVTPGHARALRDCHRTVPLPATGRPATLGALRFGARNARACVATCWVLMLVMVAAPPATHVAWTAALAVAVAAQKVARRPRRVARCVGGAFAVAAVVVLPGGTLASTLAAALVLATASLPLWGTSVAS